ncbi:MAG: SRPBCC domain-containing protein [Bacteroidetes bacterium]|nr:SRPBCC domain-containing protein [Bacteroidota bacterium]
MKLPVHAVITGLFTAPPERVFQSFLDRDMIAQFMFGPGVREETIVGLANDPRPGGRFCYAVRRGDKLFEHVGEYIEINPPKRLVFTWGVKQDPSGAVSQVLIEIAPIINGCELTLTHEMVKGSEDFVEKSKQAWGKMIDKLAEVIG